MSTRQSVSSIAIIGSGIGGVAAAVALRQAGLDAVLYHALSNISERSDPLMSKSFQYLAGAALISFCLWLYSSSIVSASGAENYATQANGDVGSLYNKKCAECHGKDGRSKSFKGKLSHARDLTDAEWQQRVSDERIYNSISNGKGKMPGFGKKLSETEINSLTKYVRDLKK